MKQQLSSRHLLMGGLVRVCTTLAVSSAAGLDGLLVFKSFTVPGVLMPLVLCGMGDLSAISLSS